MKKIIGAGLIALPFAVVAAVTWQTGELKAFVAVFVVLTFASFGICLMSDE